MQAAINKILTLYLLLLCAGVGSVFAQSDTVQLQLVETFSGHSLPFAKVTVAGTDYMADAGGSVKILIDTSNLYCTVNVPFHRPTIHFIPAGTSDTVLTANLYLPFLYHDVTEPDLKLWMQTVVFKNRAFFAPRRRKGYEYTAYSKATMNMPAKQLSLPVTMWMNRIVGDTLPVEKAHLFISESVSHTRFRTPDLRNEKMLAAQFTGIENPGFLSFTAGLSSYSPYETFLKVGGKDYPGPLHPGSLKRYVYKCEDTVRTATGPPVYVIKFNPAPYNFFEALCGFLYIRSDNGAVVAITARPAELRALHINLIHEAVFSDSLNMPVPVRALTSVDFDFAGTGTVDGIAEIYYFNQVFDSKPGLRDADYNEIPSGDSVNTDTDSLLIATVRPVPLTPKDENTYDFYRNNTSVKKLDRFLRLGERLYFGYVPVGFVDFRLNRAISFSDYEKLRLGLGVRTNDRVSKTVQPEMYAGYGIGDERWKGGGSLRIMPLENKIHAWEAKVYHDLTESGNQEFDFDKPMFSSEPLRKYLLNVMDYTTGGEVNVYTGAGRFLRLRAGVVFNHLEPNYFYVFKNDTLTGYSLRELKAGVRWAYGEQFLKTGNNRISLGTRFPVVYCNVSKGLRGTGEYSGDYEYTRINVKVDYERRFPGWGRSSLRTVAGTVEGDVPYSLLYNMYGSLRSFSVVIHNSFETMAYNEFLADRFGAVFYSHNFGRMRFLARPDFSPSVEMIHNMGYGTLSNPEDHRGGIAFKVPDKGYFESGLYINDLIVLRMPGLKTGVGGGVFFRYGAYALPGITNNAVFKFSINFRP